jgi:uncharacterized protein (DUF697 family)
MFQGIRRWWDRERERTDVEFQSRLERLRQQEPIPVFWLFGKTQSGKTTVIRHLTGASDAEIGNGFQPCTRFSRQYEFPSKDAALLKFLDTRGIDEPGYDPAEDRARFNDTAHLVIVTVKALDHAQENIVKHLNAIRDAQRGRQIVLLLTCLHEAYPQQQHPKEFPFSAQPADQPIECRENSHMLTDLVRSMELQRRRFAGLVDHLLPIDITRPDEGFDQPDFGGPQLRRLLTEILPEAQAQTLKIVEDQLAGLEELHARKVMPTILGHSLLAASAGAIPIPFVSLLLLPRIQRMMIRTLAEKYGRPAFADQFLHLANQFGMGHLRYHAAGELLKLVPTVGVVAGATGHAASTYAVGKSFCHYDAGLSNGAGVDLEELRSYYRSQLDEAKNLWKSEPAVAAETVAAEVPQ